MPSIFVSYSRVDEAFAHQLATRLAEAGANVWIDIEDIPAGMNWSSAIQQGLDTCDVLLIVLSPDSMASANVSDEWQFAKDHGTPLIPLLWRPTRIHFQLHRLQYVDFQTQDFDTAFRQLASELKHQGAALSLGEDDELNVPSDQKPLETQEAPAITSSLQPTMDLDERLAVNKTPHNASVQVPISSHRKTRFPWLPFAAVTTIAIVIATILLNNPTIMPTFTASINDFQPITTSLISDPRDVIYLSHINPQPPGSELVAQPNTWIPPDRTVELIGQVENPNDNTRWFLAQIPHAPDSYGWLAGSHVPEDMWGSISTFTDIETAQVDYAIPDEIVEAAPYTQAKPLDDTALYNVPDWEYIDYDNFQDHFEEGHEGTLDVYLQWFDRTTGNGWFLARSSRNGLLGWIPYNDITNIEGHPTFNNTPVLNIAIHEDEIAFYPFDVQETLSFMSDSDEDESPAFRDGCPDLAGKAYSGCPDSDD